MGYDFYGYGKKTDDEYIFTTECQYAYESAFKECFGVDILYFNGRVTKQVIKEFEDGLKEFTGNPARYNIDDALLPGNLANKQYEALCAELNNLLSLMKERKVKYLRIA